MALKNVIIFWTNGNLLVSKSYGFQEKDTLILTGLLSAFENLTEDLGEGGIKNISMHEHQILMNIKNDICFAIFFNQDDDEKQGIFISDKIIEAFFTIYKGTQFLQPGRLIEASSFNPFLNILDDLAVLKDIFELIESSSKKLSVSEILEQIKTSYNKEISNYEAWKALNILVFNQKIIKADDEDSITFRKKGEILKKFKFKLKDD